MLPTRSDDGVSLLGGRYGNAFIGVRGRSRMDHFRCMGVHRDLSAHAFPGLMALAKYLILQNKMVAS